MIDESPPSWAVRIETKLDVVIKANDDHERRIRALERWMYLAIGAGAIGAGTGVASLFGG